MDAVTVRTRAVSRRSESLCLAAADLQQEARSTREMVARHVRALKSLRAIYVDCGWRDQYHLHFGARLLSLALARRGIAHVYEEFDDGHMNITYRYDRSYPFVARALSGRG